ncbi:hypothetical protein Pan258_14110 [Symmachiella dynata]|nr:hypothetical protein Pan258_14110 [Symmachiella dynata]
MKTKHNTCWYAANACKIAWQSQSRLGVCASFSTILWDHVSANARRLSLWLRVAECVHPQNHVGHITLDNRHVGIHMSEF